ncbi:MAG: hypothetical protein R3F19_03790 [Verrucomicrobiales bacterium]
MTTPATVVSPSTCTKSQRPDGGRAQRNPILYDASYSSMKQFAEFLALR